MKHGYSLFSHLGIRDDTDLAHFSRSSITLSAMEDLNAMAGTLEMAGAMDRTRD